MKISEELGSYSEYVSRSWVTQVTENLPERYMRNMTVTFDGSKPLYRRKFNDVFAIFLLIFQSTDYCFPFSGLNRMRAFTMLRASKVRAKDLRRANSGKT